MTRWQDPQPLNKIEYDPKWKEHNEQIEQKYQDKLISRQIKREEREAKWKLSKQNLIT